MKQEPVGYVLLARNAGFDFTELVRQFPGATSKQLYALYRRQHGALEFDAFEEIGLATWEHRHLFVRKHGRQHRWFLCAIRSGVPHVEP